MDELVALTVDPVINVTGDRAHIVLHVEIPDNVHIEPHLPADPFLIPTVVTVNGLEDVEIVYPDPVLKDLGWNDTALSILEGAVKFTVTGRIPSGTTSVAGGLSYQPCLGGACLPPRTAVWSVALTTMVDA